MHRWYASMSYAFSWTKPGILLWRSGFGSECIQDATVVQHVNQFCHCPCLVHHFNPAGVHWKNL